jgi:hypothetical protein
MDTTGVLGHGEWHVGFQHRDRPEWLDVVVPVLGEVPRIGVLSDSMRAWGWPVGSVPAVGDVAAAPSVDSPVAMPALMEALTRQGVPVLLDEATLLWVSRHPQRGQSWWMLESVDGILPARVDARTGRAVDWTPAPGTLPTVPQAPAR